MKQKIFLSLLLSCILTTAYAQEVRLGPLHSPDSMREDWLLPGDTVMQKGQPFIYQGKPVKNQQYTVAEKSHDSFAQHYVPQDSTILYSPIDRHPYPGNSFGLHRGLNASIDLSAFATLGKNLPHKGGFSQNINLTYLAPLTKNGKLWIAAGGYLNNTFWGKDSYRDAGLYAILGYRFNEHWEAYVYGQLSLTNNYSSLYGRYGGYGYGLWPYGYGAFGPMTGVMPMGYGMGAAGANVLGAGVRYNVNRNLSIGLNIEGVWYNNNSSAYFDRYNYPVPPSPGK